MSIKINGGVSNVNAEVDPISQALRVALYDVNGIPIGPRRTYDAATFPFTPGTTPTDVFTISGAATRIIRITRVRLSGIQNTAGINSWYLLKRSTLNTGGTSTLITNVSRDSTQLAALAIVRSYTADPATGTLVGLIRSGKLLTPSNTSLASDTLIWDFDDIQSNPVVLNNANELIAINFNSAALPAGLSIHCCVTWTEE